MQKRRRSYTVNIAFLSNAQPLFKHLFASHAKENRYNFYKFVDKNSKKPATFPDERDLQLPLLILLTAAPGLASRTLIGIAGFQFMSLILRRCFAVKLLYVNCTSYTYSTALIIITRISSFVFKYARSKSTKLQILAYYDVKGKLFAYLTRQCFHNFCYTQDV